MNGGYYPPSSLLWPRKESCPPSPRRDTTAVTTLWPITTSSAAVSTSIWRIPMAQTNSILYDYTGSSLFYLNPIYSNLSECGLQRGIRQSLIELWNDWQAYEIISPYLCPHNPSHRWLGKSNLTCTIIPSIRLRSDKTGPLAALALILEKDATRLWRPLETVVSQDTDFPAGFKLQGTTSIIPAKK